MNNQNNERPIAIKLVGVKKKYRLGQIGGGTLRGDIQSWIAKKRGKEDPNAKIGQKKRLVGQTFMALNGIDCTIYQGEAVGIIGSNGAGKSTLLKILSRVTAPTEGEIDIYGRIASMLEVGTGFNAEMTGRENVYMNGTILGMTKEEIDEKMDDIIEFSEVKDFIDTPVKRYSSGMFVKLAFSVAAHLNSEIMIMDEVLAVGDMAFQKKCLDKMREAAKQDGRTVLYVSHNMNTIRQLCDRCIVLKEGQIIYEGDVESSISIYLDQSCDGNETNINLDTKTHADNECNFNIRMNRLELVGKDMPIYDDQETMKLKVDITVNKPLDNVVFRLTLRTDGDIGVGTSWSTPINFTETGKKTLSFEFDSRVVSRGVYYGSIGFYQTNSTGAVTMLDHVIRAFKFELIEVPKKEGMVWYPSYWGYTKLPDMTAEIK